MPARDSSEANWLEIFFMVLTNFQDSVELKLLANRTVPVYRQTLRRAQCLPDFSRQHLPELGANKTPHFDGSALT